MADFPDSRVTLKHVKERDSCSQISSLKNYIKRANHLPAIGRIAAVQGGRGGEGRCFVVGLLRVSVVVWPSGCAGEGVLHCLYLPLSVSIACSLYLALLSFSLSLSSSSPARGYTDTLYIYIYMLKDNTLEDSAQSPSPSPFNNYHHHHDRETCSATRLWAACRQAEPSPPHCAG